MFCPYNVSSNSKSAIFEYSKISNCINHYSWPLYRSNENGNTLLTKSVELDRYPNIFVNQTAGKH